VSERDRLDAEHYRSLFEGSQASLSDMAARQAQALGRVGRLRSAIVAVLRKNFMELSAQAEANLGGRLSEVDDEILLAYLDAFTAAASRGDQRATIQALKEAVTTLGIPLRGEEPLVWVEQIHQHRQRLQKSGRDARDAARDETAGTAQPAAPATRPAPAPAAPSKPAATEQPLPVDDYWKWDDATPLGDLFDDIPADIAADIPADADGAAEPAGTAQPRRWENQLGTPVTGEDRWTPSPIVPALAPRQGPAPTPAVALEPEETITSAATAWGGTRGAANPTADAGPTPDAAVRQPTATDAPAAQTQPAQAAGQNARIPTKRVVGGGTTTKRQPRRRATAPGEDVNDGATDTATANVATSTADNGAPADAVSTAGTTTATSTDDGRRPAPRPALVPPATLTGRPPLVANPDNTAADNTADDTADDLTDLFEEPAATPTTAASSVALGDPGVVGAPLRPELFAPTTPKRRRNARTKAQPPLEEIPLPGGETLELNDGMRRALLAAASIPRPVFTRDLVGVAGSLAMVDAWEAECRSDVSSSPVRFVAPKSRHRLRGHLVAVEPAVVRPGDWWYQAVQRYRAGRLYELAVLLHRVGDEIVSFSLEDHLAVFRLNTPRGLVGMVVLLDPRPVVGGESSAGLAGHLENLLAERLTMIAVLTASAEPGSLENLIAHVEQLAANGRWQPTAPVIAARSWEYADDRGTSAVMVLGQS